VPNVYTFKDFEGSSHRILIRLIRRFAKRGGLLLDLGAAGGELGAAVRDHFTRTIGFEYEVDCLSDLRGRFDRILITDLERVKRLPAAADAIVLADVLEHLRDAPSLLRLVRNALSKDGHLFVSVPNIANITVRLGLLFGIFEYRERGILDNTHLRFYTLRTIRREIESAGFRIVAISGSSIPLRLIVSRHMPEPLLRLGERVLTMLTRMWKSLFAYQIIIVAVPLVNLSEGGRN
jgi:predicted TPR repeat methyltransferase